MANEKRNIFEEKIVIPGGNIYSNTVKKTADDTMNKALHTLYFNAYQNLLNEIGLHSNIELGLHIRAFSDISQFEGPDNMTLYCRMDTIPIIEQEYRYIKSNVEIEPYIPHNRKCTLRERLKILFRGEL